MTVRGPVTLVTNLVDRHLGTVGHVLEMAAQLVTESHEPFRRRRSGCRHLRYSSC